MNAPQLSGERQRDRALSLRALHVSFLAILSLGLLATPAVAQEGDEYVTRSEYNELKQQLELLLNQQNRTSERQTETGAASDSGYVTKQEFDQAFAAFNPLRSEMQYFRPRDKDGINVFEDPKTTDVEFNGVAVRVGGASTLQYQALDHSNSGAVALDSLSNNFNLATANLDLDVALADGVRMHLRTYLSSQNHTEAYVKGGYLQIDKLDFVQTGFLSELMDNVRIKVGHMQNNYGDNHFRRTDNAMAIYNPFAGNYLMDSFTTEVGAEVYYFHNNFFGMVGATNGKLNQKTEKTAISARPSYLAKVGYDSQINEDWRVRLTGSVYVSPESPFMFLYTGDRAGSRYYNVMEGSFRSGRVNPGFGNEVTAFMFNPFIKYKGWEFYGVLEHASGKSASQSSTRTFNQYAGELLYRFGEDERFYVGGRYNLVTGELASGHDVSVSRYNIGGGWFLTDNILAKLEYVSQKYNDFPEGSILEDGRFSGFMLEATISF